MKRGIFVSFALIVITIISWVFSSPDTNYTQIYLVSHLIGAFSLVGFALNFFISTRHQILDEFWHGLDKAYVAHKWIGISSVGLAICHIVMLQMARQMEILPPLLAPPEGDVQPGFFSIILFLILVITALVAKRMKFEVWKTIHKFLLLPYAIGVLHYYAVSVFSFTSPFGIWMNIINIIGIASAIYSIFLYGRLAFKFKYKVISVSHVAKKTLEITGKAVNKHLTYKPGQFTFMKINKGKSKFSPHPFTLSSAPQSDTVQLTIKGIGDHTAKLMNTIRVDDEFVLTKPHGKFDVSAGGKNQIWIAGGIGVTPFRSFCQAGIPKDFSVDFFYSYNGEEGAYVEELQKYAKNILRIHLIDSTTQGYLTIDKIEEMANIQNPVDVYFCGPKPMRNSFRKGFKNSKIRVQGFHFEEFGFGR